MSNCLSIANFNPIKLVYKDAKDYLTFKTHIKKPPSLASGTLKSLFHLSVSNCSSGFSIVYGTKSYVSKHFFLLLKRKQFLGLGLSAESRALNCHFTRDDVIFPVYQSLSLSSLLRSILSPNQNYTRLLHTQKDQTWLESTQSKWWCINRSQSSIYPRWTLRKDPILPHQEALYRLLLKNYYFCAWVQFLGALAPWKEALYLYRSIVLAKGLGIQIYCYYKILGGPVKWQFGALDSVLGPWVQFFKLYSVKLFKK